MADVLEIPDIRIETAIRSDTPIEVYRGAYGPNNRAVAVKILAHSAVDTSIDRRFRIGLEIHSQLNHANLVEQLFSGELSGRPYSVEPFLAGGDLFARLESGMSLQAGLNHLKDVAYALNYMHKNGYVHGDVKPANLLFGSNAHVHLIDFSITRKEVRNANDLGRGISVLATPEYMAPEALSGSDIRSDIYSLGVVFYRMLAGKLPYEGNTPQEIIARHTQDPVPRLPEYLAHLQPIVDKAMAKRVEQRYQSMTELVRAVDEIRSEAQLPSVNMKTRPIATQEIRVLANGNVLATVRDSGRQQQLEAMSQRRRRVRRTATTFIFAGGLIYGGYVALERGYITTEVVLAQLGVVADPQLTTAWNEAQSLREDPNQGLAAIVAAYRRVLAISPGHEGATPELRNVAADWKQSIAEALQANNLQFAETRLNEANSVFPNDLDWANLNSDLLNRLSAERIYINSVTLLSSQGLSDLPSATAAIQSFHEVFRLSPGHSGAKEQLRTLAVHYANLSRDAVGEGRLNDGISLLERATAADNTIPELDNVRRQISQATTARAAIDELLREARRLRAQNQLMLPAGQNAAEFYYRVLATDPENAIAIQGLDEITAQVAADAEVLLSVGELAQVETIVNQAQAAGLPAEGVGEIRRRLEAERTRQATIRQNIEDARVLFAAGFLTDPVGENAVAKLREVQQVDPGNETALELLQRCAERLAAVAQEARRFGLNDNAEQYLDLAITIQPDVADWVALRDGWEDEKTD